MINEVQALMEQYQSWLRDRTHLRQIDRSVEITTPYLDRHNDYIQIYVKKENGHLLLTDDQSTIEDLERCGLRIHSPKRQDLLRLTLNGFGVELENGALQVHANSENFALRKHNLVQAILAVNDLFYLAEPLVTGVFFEDVTAWFEIHDIRYTPRVKFTGKSGYDHLFDFVIPKSKAQPERILRAISHPNRDTAQGVAFSWIDTKDVRSPDSRAYAILNNMEREVSSSVIDALVNYSVKPVLWSKREEFWGELAA